jgi:hypothetical protein
MALGMNELKMDSLRCTQDGTNLGWIRQDGITMERAQDGFIGMERAWDGFVETNCQPGPLTPRPQGAGRAHAFIHPRGVRLWVKPHVVVGKFGGGRGGGVDHLNTFAQYYLRSSPTTQANIFTILAMIKNIFDNYRFFFKKISHSQCQKF